MQNFGALKLGNHNRYRDFSTCAGLCSSRRRRARL